MLVEESDVKTKRVSLVNFQNSYITFSERRRHSFLARVIGLLLIATPMIPLLENFLKIKVIMV